LDTPQSNGRAACADESATFGKFLLSKILAVDNNRESRPAEPKSLQDKR